MFYSFNIMTTQSELKKVTSSNKIEFKGIINFMQRVIRLIYIYGKCNYRNFVFKSYCV